MDAKEKAKHTIYEVAEKHNIVVNRFLPSAENGFTAIFFIESLDSYGDFDQALRDAGLNPSLQRGDKLPMVEGRRLETFFKF